MTENDIYQQLAEMIDREDVVGGPVTPALLRLIKLQFTPKDADLAVKITLTGGTLDELSDRLAMDKHKLSQKLLAMADKGTIIYDPADENPVYRCVGMTAGGLTETGMWGGIRFPFSVQLGKELNQLSRDHAEGALAKLGFPFTPVWAGMLALPDDALPEENLAEAVKDAGHWSVSLCPCRTSRALVTPEDTCEHMMQTCVHTGPLSRWAVKHGMARELTYDELVELLKKCKSGRPCTHYQHLRPYLQLLRGLLRYLPYIQDGCTDIHPLPICSTTGRGGVHCMRYLCRAMSGKRDPSRRIRDSRSG
jgi:hypothetical protein